MLKGNKPNQLSAVFFGGIKIYWNRKALVQFATKKALALFCFLLDSPETEHPREKIMSYLWGDFSDNQARYNLRYSLWNIRKLFNDDNSEFDPFISGKTFCKINPDIDVQSDVRDFVALVESFANAEDFNKLQEAIDLYSGDYLDGFEIRGVPQWDDWLAIRRKDLLDMYLNSSVQLAEHYIDKSNSPQAESILNKALFYNPEFEKAHEALINAYAVQGKVSSVLRQFDKYAQMLETEFGLPPNPETAELVAQLKAGTYQKISGQNMDRVVVPLSDDEGAHPVKTDFDQGITTGMTGSGSDELILSSLIGRTEELAKINRIISEANDGSGRVLVISGELGIGKTRLFTESLKRVPSEFIVGTGESEEIESTQPLDEWISILKELSADSRVSSAMKSGLANIFKGAELTETDEDDSKLIMQRIRSWINELAVQHPVLIAIDDLHWASNAVLEIFSMLAQDAKKLPLVLIGIFRSYELQSEDAIASSLISIARTGKLSRIELKQLSEEETYQLIEYHSERYLKQLATNEKVKLFEYSSGVPLYAIELTRFIEEGNFDILDSPSIADEPDFKDSADLPLVPPLITKITNLRVSSLERDAQNLLKKSALILGESSYELLRLLSGLDSEALEEALLDLERRNFILHKEVGDRIEFRFTHRMIRLAIVNSLSVIEKRKYCKAILHALKVVSANVSTDAMAYYRYISGDRTGSTPLLLISAAKWLKLGDAKKGLYYSNIACNIAMEQLREDPLESVQTILEHAENLVSGGYIKEAVDLYDATIENLHKLAETSYEPELAELRSALTEKLKEVQPDDRGNEQALALITMQRAMAGTRLIQGDVSGARKLISEAEESISTLSGDAATFRETGMVFQVFGKIAQVENNPADAVQYFKNAVELLKNHGTQLEYAETQRLLATALLEQDKLPAALEVVENCINEKPENEISLEMLLCKLLVARIFSKDAKYEVALNFHEEILEVSDGKPEFTFIRIESELDRLEILELHQGRIPSKEKLESIQAELKDTKERLLRERVERLKDRWYSSA